MRLFSWIHKFQRWFNKCLCCNKNYHQKFDEKLKKRFFNTDNFSNHDNTTKLNLLLRKGVCPYDREKFNETSLPEEEDFCSHINLVDITDADFAQAKRVCKDFEIKS